MSLTIRIRLDTAEAADMIRRVTAGAPRALEVAVRASMAFIVRYIVTRKLSGQVLHHITWTLIRNVTASPRIEKADESGVVGALGTSLDYGAAHEEGFKGAVQVREHVRHLSRPATSARSAAAKKRSLRADRKQYAHVRAYTMRVNIRARRYIASSMRETVPSVLFRVKKAIAILYVSGRMPKASELAPGAGELSGGAA